VDATLREIRDAFEAAYFAEDATSVRPARAPSDMEVLGDPAARAEYDRQGVVSPQQHPAGGELAGHLRPLVVWTAWFVFALALDKGLLRPTYVSSALLVACIGSCCPPAGRCLRRAREWLGFFGWTSWSVAVVLTPLVGIVAAPREAVPHAFARPAARAVRPVRSDPAGGIAAEAPAVNSPKAIIGIAVLAAVVHSLLGTSAPASGVAASVTSLAAVPAGSVTPATWAEALLGSLGDQASPENMRALIAWERAEGGHWANSARFNPLNTTQPEPGSWSMNSVGVQAYASWLKA